MEKICWVCGKLNNFKDDIGQEMLEKLSNPSNNGEKYIYDIWNFKLETCCHCGYSNIDISTGNRHTINIVKDESYIERISNEKLLKLQEMTNINFLSYFAYAYINELENDKFRSAIGYFKAIRCLNVALEKYKSLYFDINNEDTSNENIYYYGNIYAQTCFEKMLDILYEAKKETDNIDCYIFFAFVSCLLKRKNDVYDVLDYLCFKKSPNKKQSEALKAIRLMSKRLCN